MWSGSVFSFSRSHVFRARFPHPIDDADNFLLTIRAPEFAEPWRLVCEEVCVQTSIFDRAAPETHIPLAAESSLFVCSQCPHRPAFKSAKALAMHARVKHGVRNSMREFVPSMLLFAPSAL